MESGSAADVEAPPVVVPVIPEEFLNAPQEVRLKYESAVDRMELGEDAAAARLFERFVVDHPEYPGAYVNLAIIYERQGRLEDAEFLLNQAIEAAPFSVYALNRLGLLKRRQGDFEAAEQAWLQATRSNPRYPYAWYNLGVLYDLYLQDLPAALDSYRNYQEVMNGNEPDPAVERWITDLERRLGEPARLEQVRESS
jgi:tetratricopeptide (TPR) repeat protein